MSSLSCLQESARDTVLWQLWGGFVPGGFEACHLDGPARCCHGLGGMAFRTDESMCPLAITWDISVDCWGRGSRSLGAYFREAERDT